MRDTAQCSEIRLAQLTDESEAALVPSIRRISESAFTQFGSYLSTIEYWLKSEHAVTVCALRKHHLVGFIIYVYRSHDGGLCGEIIAIAVDSKARRQGIGQRLLEKALSALNKGASEVGATSIVLHVADKNHSAQQLFLKMGFSPSDSVERYPNGDIANRMTMPLF